MQLHALQNTLYSLMQDSNQEVGTEKNRQLYMNLITEEYKELMAEQPGQPDHFKELCDLMWVLIQEANQCGYDLEDGMNALIVEYKSKFLTAEGKYQPLFREDGKLMKNTGFQKANFKDLLCS